MKRITLIVAAIVCLAMTAMAQTENADTTIQTSLDEAMTLAPAQWQQGIAICAQYTAYDKGFSKRIEDLKAQYPNGYTLEDLNEVYGSKGQKWEKIYQEFKQQEGKTNCTVADLKGLVKPQIWRLVEPDLQEFLKAHPESATAAVAPVQGDSVPQEGAVPAEEKQESTCCGTFNWPLWLGIIAALLGLWALLTALGNRSKIAEMRRTFARELDRTNANLQEFSDAAADELKALSIRMTAGRGEVTTAVATAIEAAQQEREAGAIAEEEEEPMTLYMAKPDENDDFTRVSDAFEPGNSIYILNTADGLHGTFEVIDKEEVHAFALMMPAENLIRACSGNAIQIPNGKRIVTDRPGEAEFIDGNWHIVVKAIIHYEA